MDLLSNLKMYFVGANMAGIILVLLGALLKKLTSRKKK
jgi:hypothetical protein